VTISGLLEIWFRRFQKEIRGVNPECARNPAQYGDRGIFFAALDPADITSVDPGLMGELLLGEAGCIPQPSYVQPNDRLPLHARMKGKGGQGVEVL
jgi:hypothetical protein